MSLADLEKNRKSKIDFLNQNKAVIANNIESFGYPLLNVLISDDSIENIEESLIINDLINKLGNEKTVLGATKDLSFILHTIMSCYEKGPNSYEQKEKVRKRLAIYNTI